MLLRVTAAAVLVVATCCTRAFSQATLHASIRCGSSSRFIDEHSKQIKNFTAHIIPQASADTTSRSKGHLTLVKQEARMLQCATVRIFSTVQYVRSMYAACTQYIRL
jgi:hypothetical protein